MTTELQFKVDKSFWLILRCNLPGGTITDRTCPMSRIALFQWSFRRQKRYLLARMLCALSPNQGVAKDIAGGGGGVAMTVRFMNGTTSTAPWKFTTVTAAIRGKSILTQAHRPVTQSLAGGLSHE